MIMRKVICFTLLFMFISLSRSKICQVRTSSNLTKDVCCADYEKKENDCIACLKGFTSYMGQNCYPCMKNTYGERCRYECQCSDFEVCDNVEGCVNYESTTGISVFATSSTSVQRSGEKTCGVNTKWGTIQVCCADFEEKGKGCIACSSGYTSMMGQKCRPCQNNTYGERCKYECSCTRFERCDLADGCVLIQPITDTSEYVTTHDITSQWTGITGTDSEIVVDTTSSLRETSTNEESTDCSVQHVQGLLLREIIVYSALSVLVIGFGLCLCFVFLKYKILSKKNIVTLNRTHMTSVTQQIQTHEIADRLYDIINEEDILGDRHLQQIQTPSSYLDVVHDSNTRESCESNRCVNQDNPCQLLSVIQTQNREHNLKVDDHSLTSGDSTSSSDAYQWDSTQDYLNPYQPMIEISPPGEHKYLTIAHAHSRVDGHYKDAAIVNHEHDKYELHHPREVETDDMVNRYDNYTSSSVTFGSNVSKSFSKREEGQNINHTKM